MNEITKRLEEKRRLRFIVTKIVGMHEETYQTRYAHLAPDIEAIISAAKAEHLMNDREAALLRQEMSFTVNDAMSGHYLKPTK